MERSDVDLHAASLCRTLSFKHHLSPPALNVRSVEGGLFIHYRSFAVLRLYKYVLGMISRRPALNSLARTLHVSLSQPSAMSGSPNGIERITDYCKRCG